MSPPKVSLSGKDSTKSATDEFLSDKGDGTEFPSVIIVETEHRASSFRQQIRRQRYRRVIVGVTVVIMVSVAALLALTIVNVLHRRHHKTWTVKSSSGVPTKVTVDENKNLIHAAHDYDTLSQTSRFEILHEYGRKLIAYKDMKNLTCYIDRLDESFQDGYERYQSYKDVSNDHQALKVISEPIEVEVLEHIGYIHIFGHCQNAQSYWVMEVEGEEVTTAMRIVYV